MNRDCFCSANNRMTLGSLFDGIGGFPLAAVRHGVTPLWASEIEKFPIAVTKKRFPGMLHVGDITRLKGAELPPVNIITGGSPCQDLSVAGKRAGLTGARSGLFMEQIRLIKEMRAADEARNRSGGTAHAVHPRYMCWENVPGAFSSAGGEDFRAVLEETLRIIDSAVSVPRPPNGRWESAGAVLGNEFSLAWRVLDARYWGVPQRRRRIFLVADFGGSSAPEILFEQDRLFGDSAAGENARQRTAAPASGGAGNASNGMTPDRMMLSAGFSAGAASTAGGIGWQEECSPTLRGTGSGNMMPSVMATQQGGAEIGMGVCPAITAAAGTSGNNQPVLFENHEEDRTTLRKLIRRLTPLECERLQGYPDGWTDVPGASDSARYKALGNSVAVPCVEFVMRGIAYFLSMEGGR